MNKLKVVKSLLANFTHAKHVLDNFHNLSLNEYMALYILSLICILADVFQGFQNKFFDEY